MRWKATPSRRPLLLREARQVSKTYRDDFGKYANQVKHLYLQKVLDTAPRLVGQRYKYVNVDRELRSRELKEALLLLVRAGLIHHIHATSGAGLPLAAYSKDHLFKVLFLDVGLMQHACGLDAAIATATDFLAINAGAVAEQLVGQELLAYSPAYEETALFFWQREQRNSQAEVDYLISLDGRVIPIEVKAGKTGRLRSLKQFMTDYDCPLESVSRKPQCLFSMVCCQFRCTPLTNYRD
jgi:predicted AAA+ superfamily ATPase